MKPQEMIDVIQAHADGKQIEFRCVGTRGDNWSPMLDGQGFDFVRFEYRVKPAVLRPHWSALIRCRGVEQPVMGDMLFATEDAAREHYTCMDIAIIRLATEYPPVMLP